MASIRSKQQLPVGSQQWVANERQQAQEFIDQEVEEFAFAARNDLEWLNEHMAEIFNRSQLNIADVFKTPGKLRGKTPRTARNQNGLQARAPLTDVFAPNVQSPRSRLQSPQKQQYKQPPPQFRIAEDKENEGIVSEKTKHFEKIKHQADSGYHGSTEDEMEVDELSAPNAVPTKTSVTDFVRPDPPQRQESEARATDSFVSAEETLGNRGGLKPDTRKADIDATEIAPVQPSQGRQVQQQNKQLKEIEDVARRVTQAPGGFPESRQGTVDITDDAMEVEPTHTPSDGSTPEKPLVRKSSLTFAALPAREPLKHKSSFGVRTSTTDPFKTSVIGRASQFGQVINGGKSLGGSQQQQQVTMDDAPEMTEIQATRPALLQREESETTKLHNMTSTQRLHERMAMLGQTKEPRPKSLHATNPQHYPKLASEETENTRPQAAARTVKAPTLVTAHDDDDDWITPMDKHPGTAAPTAADVRPMLVKSNSTDVMESITGKSTIGRFGGQDMRPTPIDDERPRTSPGRNWETHTIGLSKKQMAISQPDLTAAVEPFKSYTPAGSPAHKRHPSGPLSASKAKLYSVLKSAKGIFASSAGVSAAAKMEVLSPPSKGRLEQAPPSPGLKLVTDVEYPDLDARERAPPSPTREEGRRTRSSSEREQKRKEREAEKARHVDEQLEKAREKERQKAAAQKAQADQRVVSQSSQVSQSEAGPSRDVAPSVAADDANSEAAELSQSQRPQARNLLPAGSQQKPLRRLAKPSKEQLPKVKPAPVTIRVASQRIGTQAPTSNAPAGSASELAQSTSQPRPNLHTQASNGSLHRSASNTTLKSSTSSARPKALEAAAKKKELDEKAAQRKAEQKRELEQRRAAKLEEDRRLEQERKAAEQERIEEAKKAAQRKLEEQRRQERLRLEEQQRRQQQLQQQAAAKAKQAAADAAAAQAERAAAASQQHTRGDVGTIRPVSRMMQDLRQVSSVIPHPPINPAKPAKRQLPNDGNDEQPQTISRPALNRAGPSYQQQNDTKRRKTQEDENEDTQPRRSVMAPPIRMSGMRKENKFLHGYQHVPPSANQHAQAMFKASQQHSVHHPPPPHGTVNPNDLAHISTAKIPFAPAPQGPSGATNSHTQGMGGAPNHFKTPAGKSTATIISTSTITKTVPLKSSPHYNHGDGIALPEIQTDSEDEDSDASPAFKPPSWVNSPALREMLATQQLVDPESVFGPIARLDMDEVFKGGKGKRFRDRTSSANWSGNDRLTEEERRRDREERMRVARDGGWSFQPGNGGRS